MNKYAKIAISTLAILTAGGLGIKDAAASVIATVNMSYLYAGEYPGSPTSGNNYLTATISTTGTADTYQIAFSSYLQPGQFVGGVNKSIGWAFKMVPTITSFTQISGLAATICNNTGGSSGCTINAGPLNTAAGFNWNLGFYWGNNNFLGTGANQSVYDFTTTSSMTNLASFFGNTPTPDGIYSVAHVQGIQNTSGSGGTCSVWVTNSGTTGGGSTIQPCNNQTAVPEPSELPMMALGLCLIAGGLYTRKKRQG